MTDRKDNMTQYIVVWTGRYENSSFFSTLSYTEAYHQFQEWARELVFDAGDEVTLLVAVPGEPIRSERVAYSDGENTVVST